MSLWFSAPEWPNSQNQHFLFSENSRTFPGISRTSPFVIEPIIFLSLKISLTSRTYTFRFPAPGGPSVVYTQRNFLSYFIRVKDKQGEKTKDEKVRFFMLTYLGFLGLLHKVFLHKVFRLFSFTAADQLNVYIWVYDSWNAIWGWFFTASRSYS